MKKKRVKKDDITPLSISGAMKEDINSLDEDIGSLAISPFMKECLDGEERIMKILLCFLEEVKK